jgi:hypothetical protein
LLAPPPRDGVQPTRWEVINSVRFENGILAVAASYFAGDTHDNVVYLYELDANGKLVRRATLRPSDSLTFDTFGSDVAVAGNTVVVGDPQQLADHSVPGRRCNRPLPDHR